MHPVDSRARRRARARHAPVRGLALNTANMAYVPTDYRGPAAGVAFDHPPEQAGLRLPQGVTHHTFASQSMGCDVGYNILLPPSCASHKKPTPSSAATGMIYICVCRSQSHASISHCAIIANGSQCFALPSQV